MLDWPEQKKTSPKFTPVAVTAGPSLAAPVTVTVHPGPVPQLRLPKTSTMKVPSAAATVLNVLPLRVVGALRRQYDQHLVR